MATPEQQTATAVPTSAHAILAVLIDEALGEGDIIPTEEAERITQIMANEHPGAWQDFLNEEGTRLVKQFLVRALQSRRQRARHLAPREAFSRNAEKDIEIFKAWRCRIDEENRQRAIGDMTGRDHIFVAHDYERSANQAKTLAAFHLALAKKCGERKTSEVMDEREFERIYRSITDTSSLPTPPTNS